LRKDKPGPVSPGKNTESTGLKQSDIAPGSLYNLPKDKCTFLKTTKLDKPAGGS
jgi:hypothetical protein